MADNQNKEKRMAIEYVMKQIVFNQTGQADEESYHAQVVNGESFGPDDLVDYVSRVNSGVSKPEIASIEAAFEDAFSYFLSQGRNFHSPIFRMRLSIRGRYAKGELPTSKNIHVNAAVTSLLQKATKNTTLKYGQKAIKWAIERVHDVTTGLDDGVITCGRNIRIEGKGLELVATGDMVEFIDFLGSTPTITIEAGQLAVNTPSLLVVDVPKNLALSGSMYHICVTTHYRTTGVNPAPHEITYDVPLTAHSDN
jgi:hypothetical protein